MIRRIAVHRVIVGGKVIPMCVVGIENNGVVAFYESFSGEPPFTEWIGGTVVFGKDEWGRMVIEKYEDS